MNTTDGSGLEELKRLERLEGARFYDCPSWAEEGAFSGVVSDGFCRFYRKKC